jgi:hypothetical protein
MPQGKLQVNLRAKVQPTDQAALDYLTGCVRFEVEAIGDSNLEWGTGNEFASYDGSGKFTNSATFHGLPTSNGAFGPKIAKLFVDNRWELDSQQQIRVFFPADATNHPPDGSFGANRGTYCGVTQATSPNWYYYWMQTQAGQAGFGTPQFCANEWCWMLSHTVCESAPNPPWVAHIHYDARNLEKVPGLPPPPIWELDNGRRVGIDYFALARLHEAKHVELWTAWGATHPSRDQVVVPNDSDNDGLPNTLESPPHYALGLKDGNDNNIDDGHEYIFRNHVWPERHIYDNEDWSNIGCKYRGECYTIE